MEIHKRYIFIEKNKCQLKTIRVEFDIHIYTYPMFVLWVFPL